MDGKEFKWEADLDLDPKEVMAFVDKMGAATIREVKLHFKTNSRAIRRAIGRLLMGDEIYLAAWRGGITILRATGKKGRPNVANLRRAAGIPVPRAYRKRKTTAAESAEFAQVVRPMDKVDLEDPFGP